jgi:hypothetical protein
MKEMNIERKIKKKEQEEKENKGKIRLLSMLSPRRKHYYPGLFYSYGEYLSKNELEKKFTEEELRKINDSIKRQITIFLN